MPYDGTRTTPSARRESSPYFEIANPQNMQIQMNRTIAGQVSAVLLEAFEDGDPPAVFAFAKKLESFANGAGSADSHAEESLTQPA